MPRAIIATIITLLLISYMSHTPIDSATAEGLIFSAILELSAVAYTVACWNAYYWEKRELRERTQRILDAMEGDE